MNSFVFICFFSETILLTRLFFANINSDTDTPSSVRKNLKEKEILKGERTEESESERGRQRGRKGGKEGGREGGKGEGAECSGNYVKLRARSGHSHNVETLWHIVLIMSKPDLHRYLHRYCAGRAFA